MSPTRVVLCLSLLCLVLDPAPGLADDAPPADTDVRIEVTATRTAEPVDPVPQSISIVTGEELEAAGATDLASALALVGGVTVAAGGDGGPAGSVPEIWGLREFDAFLLVVDGIPWGGAFNPDLPTLDLHGVDRIEILRGAAPVMYGATSFVGVIHVIHKTAGQEGGVASVHGGSYGSGGASVYTPLPELSSYRESLTASYETQGFKDDDTGFRRAHVLYRGLVPAAGGLFRFDLDLAVVKQDPSSPHPRAGKVLDPSIPIDANHNPSDARLDTTRLQLAGVYERQLAHGTLGATLALTSTRRDIVRGFLMEEPEEEVNAAGFEQDWSGTDVYADVHHAWRPRDEVSLLVGVDTLHGKGRVEGDNFDYLVDLAGGGAPRSGTRPIQESPESEDRRLQSGLYAQIEWHPADRFALMAGARLNQTQEKRRGEVVEEGVEVRGEEEETITRGSGVVGASFRLYQVGRDAIWAFADARNTYKPAAVDFGPEAELDLLSPETAQSYEAGIRGHVLDGRLSWEASYFLMDFENLVTSDVRNGLPVLVNAGEERFKGFDLELAWEIRDSLTAQLAYGQHDSRFTDYTRLFDGVPTVLDGNRLEMAPKRLAGLGVRYAPGIGILAQVVVNHVGDRFMDKRNRALADGYTTWGAAVGWQAERWGVRVDGTNLSDERPPVAESELGDAQYYLLPARAIRLTGTFRF